MIGHALVAAVAQVFHRYFAHHRPRIAAMRIVAAQAFARGNRLVHDRQTLHGEFVAIRTQIGASGAKCESVLLCIREMVAGVATVGGGGSVYDAKVFDVGVAF